MLGIHKTARAALFLRLGDNVEGKRRLAGRFRAENFNDASARQPANAESDVEAQRSC